MAARKKSKKATDGRSFISDQRRKEILGLLVMGLALLVALAVITYHPADDALLADTSVWAALSPGGGGDVQNAGGHLGALLAQALVPQFIGYCSLLLLGLLGAWGYVTFRGQKTVYLPLLTVLLGLGAFIMATVIGWFGHSLEADVAHWSGAVGTGVAGWLQHVLGAAGSFIVLTLLLLITALMIVDHDIQRSLDRVEQSFQGARDGFARWTGELKERQVERREERAALRAEKQAAQQAETPEPSPSRTAASASAKDKANAPPQPAPPSPVEEESGFRPYRGGPRLNDRFREGQQGTPQPQRERPAPPPAPPSPSLSPQPASSGDQAPAPASETASPASPAEEEAGIELTVRERVEEEKADTQARAEDATPDDAPYAFPALDLLDEPDHNGPRVDQEELEQNKDTLLAKLETYNIEISNIEAVPGPTVTRYELTPAPGVKVSRIKSLEDDLAMAMAAQSIRMIAPIPGKSAVGVEVPNRNRELVRLRDVIGTAKFQESEHLLPIAMGKTIEGKVYLIDLAKMPHLLIAGATGSGKSVGLNNLIIGLIYACHPRDLKFVMIDPKKIELQQYGGLIEHYLAIPDDLEEPITTDFEEALGVLKSCEKEMERRYDLLSKGSARSIVEYNKRLADGKISEDDDHEHLPYIVVVVDELADLMMTAGKDIEEPITRLAQMARAVGIHLVLATQRPSTDVITGLIKANFPARIAYQVPSRIDSRTILDVGGAEGLVGNGDMLYMRGNFLTRLQAPFISGEEVNRIVDHVATQTRRGPYLLPPSEENNDSELATALGVEDTDELFDKAARIIVQHQQGSVSLLQRKLAVGYTRAARIVDQLEEAGVVGPFVGSKARDVLVGDIEELNDFLNAREEDA